MPAYVVALQLQGRAALVVGEGSEAVDKCLKLVAAGACVTVVAPALDPRLAPLVEARQITWQARGFDPLIDLTPRPAVALSVASSEAAHARVVDAARSAGVLVCAVDSPGQCDFFHTATGEVGPLTVAVASEGRAPALGRRLRDELVRQLGRPLAAFADALAALRAATPPDRRRDVIGRALEGFTLEVRATLPSWAQDLEERPAGGRSDDASPKGVGGGGDPPLR